MGLLFPGADDNASGSASVMEAGKAFAALVRKPKRSVVVALFGGEELGSRARPGSPTTSPGLSTRSRACSTST